MNLTDINSLLPLALACVAFVGWLFRLEAKTATKADGSAVQMLQAEIAAQKVEAAASKARADVQDSAIKAAQDGHNSTTIEVVRLQEQIKHLTEIIERMAARDEAQRAPKRRPERGET